MREEYEKVHVPYKMNTLRDFETRYHTQEDSACPFTFFKSDYY